jgi:hypothetical protein
MVRMDTNLREIGAAAKYPPARSMIPHPFAPMGGIYFNRPPRIGVDADAVLVTAGEGNGMDTGAIDNRNLEVALSRYADDLVPWHRKL